MRIVRVAGLSERASISAWLLYYICLSASYAAVITVKVVYVLQLEIAVYSRFIIMSIDNDIIYIHC